MTNFNTRDFQTPIVICYYMADFLPVVHAGEEKPVILEPTPGAGNLVKVLKERNYKVIAPPGDFFEVVHTKKYDHVVMNPPFTPMQTSYDMLFRCMDLSDSIIALMPWHTIINGTERTNLLMDWGIKSITHLPRWVFKGSRVQTCVLHMAKGHRGITEFRNYGNGNC